MCTREQSENWFCDCILRQPLVVYYGKDKTYFYVEVEQLAERIHVGQSNMIVSAMFYALCLYLTRQDYLKLSTACRLNCDVGYCLGRVVVSSCIHRTQYAA